MYIAYNLKNIPTTITFHKLREQYQLTNINPSDILNAFYKNLFPLCSTVRPHKDGMEREVSF